MCRYLPRVVDAAAVDGDGPEEEHEEAEEGGEHQHLVVEPEPGEVEPDLVTSVQCHLILQQISLPCRRNISSRATAAAACRSFSNEPTP